MKVRKKPIVVEATPVELVLSVSKEHPEVLLDWVRKAIENQEITVYTDAIIVKTLEGRMRGEAGDFLMRGTRGELYPIKGNIFRETYEEVIE